MNKIEIARGAEHLRDNEAFKHLISEIEAGLTKIFLDASSTEKQLAEARETVRGLAEIRRRLKAQIQAPKLAKN